MGFQKQYPNQNVRGLGEQYVTLEDFAAEEGELEYGEIYSRADYPQLTVSASTAPDLLPIFRRNRPDIDIKPMYSTVPGSLARPYLVAQGPDCVIHLAQFSNQYGVFRISSDDFVTPPIEGDTSGFLSRVTDVKWSEYYGGFIVKGNGSQPNIARIRPDGSVDAISGGSLPVDGRAIAIDDFGAIYVPSNNDRSITKYVNDNGFTNIKTFSIDTNLSVICDIINHNGVIYALTSGPSLDEGNRRFIQFWKHDPSNDSSFVLVRASNESGLGLRLISSKTNLFASYIRYISVENEKFYVNYRIVSVAGFGGRDYFGDRFETNSISYSNVTFDSAVALGSTVAVAWPYASKMTLSQFRDPIQLVFTGPKGIFTYKFDDPNNMQSAGLVWLNADKTAFIGAQVRADQSVRPIETTSLFSFDPQTQFKFLPKNTTRYRVDF